MGYPNHDLVAPAILLYKPGLTKEQFVTELDKVRIPRANDDGVYQKGLEGLACLLKLEETNDLGKTSFVHSYSKEFNFNPEFNYPAVEVITEGPNYNQYKVTHQTHKKLPPKKKAFYWWHPLKVGEALRAFVYDPEKSRNEYLGKVLEVLSVDEGTDGENPYAPGTMAKQVVRLLPIKLTTTKEENYSSLDDLFKAYPQLHPMNRYDFNQGNGEFFKLYGEKLRWYQRDRKFYLDENHARRTLVAEDVLNQWTNLILTAEAVKTGFYKLLNYKGLQHMNEFFVAHPESFLEYQKAVRDAQFSDYAKSKSMSTSEFLRFRSERKPLTEEVLQSFISDLQKRAEFGGESSDFKTDYSPEELKRFVDSLKGKII